MSIVSLKMPDELASQLAAAAKKRGLSRSALLREALNAYLHGASTGSAAELVDDLIGAFRGPKDLSHHPKHMEGFGS
jgi:metal-responsive CopG/Arc/MetJ family transcriptional regulator